MYLMQFAVHDTPSSTWTTAVDSNISSRWLIVFLGALVAVGPLSIDMYLPSLPAISADLATTPDATHLTVSTFLLGFCIGMLVYGPLSDQIGRRPVLLVGLGLYAVASVACVFADNVDALVWLRFIQALGGGAAAVLARTIVRDRFEVSEAARVLSFMQVVTMLAPLLAPLLGGYLAAWFGWRSIFWLLAGFGVLALLLVATSLKETLPVSQRVKGGLKGALNGYRTVLAHRQSVLLIAGGAAAFAGMFAYITASPFVYIEHFGVQPEHYGYLFGLNICGIVIMALLNARLVRLFSVERVLMACVSVAAVAGIALAMVTVMEIGGLEAIVGLLFFYVGVTGAIGANCVGLLMGFHRNNAGSATAAFGVTQFGLGALASAAVGLLSGPQSLGVMVGVCAAGCAVCIALACLVGRSARETELSGAAA